MVQRGASSVSWGVWAACVVCLALGCAPRETVRVQGSGDVRIPGLGPCGEGARVDAVVAKDSPVVVLVHGCNASAARYRSLARVFEFHGQEALCFEYNDRARVARSARQLRAALKALSGRLGPEREVIVLGHSQGGLVARKALSGSASGTPPRVRLVTVSAPFNGIQAASDCGTPWLHVATLGATVGICRLVAGAKWNEIHPRARSVLAPEALSPHVRDHLRILTDERDSCRRRAPGQDRCLEDDFVFSLEEQRNLRIESDQRVHGLEIRAGHAEIVGNEELEPTKLIGILQEQAVLSRTPPERAPALRALLERLF
jgi:pimeloyl-ACP methyl ester carboxylesterase